jgi:predicted dehydrogenase
LKSSSLAAIGVFAANRGLIGAEKAPSEKLGIGIVGVDGRGRANFDAVAGEDGVNIVAVCDIDDRYLDDAAKRFPHAQKFHDFRRILDAKDVDAVVVSTPDHCHAFATVLALKAGKHVYCEKPLTHSVYEARLVAETAAQSRRATQMGTQIHAEPNYRRVVELIERGAIGPVREVHVWVGKNWGGGERPKESPPVPPHLHFDLWLGPAPERPYHPSYLPAEWRRWWDFGGGTLSDMGCHYMDLPFWALKLRHPTAVEAEGPPVHAETAPLWIIVRWDFPARGELPPLRMTWYDSGKRPPHFAEGKLPKWGDGVLFVGDKGMLLADYGRHVLLPEKDFKDFARQAPSIPDSIGHHREWIEAAKGRGKTLCNFDYSGALTETVLLGSVAYRAGRRLEWDAAALKATNCPDAGRFVRREYRKGWTL